MMNENLQSQINWLEKGARLDELRPFEANPRNITETQFNNLLDSLRRFGQFRPLLVTHDLRIAGGHQRLKAMREMGWDSCRVSVPDRPITDAEYRELVIRDNVNNGTWDMDELANGWDLEELREWGVQEVFDIAPEDHGDVEGGAYQVKCPGCQHVFPVKGNKA
jgi:ParB-like chromosome segregation protein Spo0J